MISVNLKRALEALLFASEKPLSAEELKEAFQDGTEISEIRVCLEELMKEYQSENRGFKLLEVAGGFQMTTDPCFATLLKRFYQSREQRRLSQASLETLSVIAYKQPVTRADIEFIRGVNVDGSLKTIFEKGLVRIVGRKEAPGRPILYGTTREFLEYFGLKSIKDLANLTEFTEKDIDPDLLPPEMKMRSEGQMPGVAGSPQEGRLP